MMSAQRQVQPLRADGREDVAGFPDQDRGPRDRSARRSCPESGQACACRGTVTLPSMDCMRLSTASDKSAGGSAISRSASSGRRPRPGSTDPPAAALGEGTGGRVELGGHVVMAHRMGEIQHDRRLRIGPAATPMPAASRIGECRPSHPRQAAPQPCFHLRAPNGRHRTDLGRGEQAAPPGNSGLAGNGALQNRQERRVRDVLAEGRKPDLGRIEADGGARSNRSVPSMICIVDRAAVFGATVPTRRARRESGSTVHQRRRRPSDGRPACRVPPAPLKIPCRQKPARPPCGKARTHHGNVEFSLICPVRWPHQAALLPI